MTTTVPIHKSQFINYFFPGVPEVNISSICLGKNDMIDVTIWGDGIPNHGISEARIDRITTFREISQAELEELVLKNKSEQMAAAAASAIATFFHGPDAIFQPRATD